MSTFQPTYTAWSPSRAGFPVTDEAGYTGRHRRPDARRGFWSMFYVGRHRRRH
jgi:hypothetical protein